MQLQRYADWAERLDQFLLSVSRFRFRYGAGEDSQDCALFVANAVYAMTGTDLAARFRGQYHSRKEALALAKSHTGKVTLRPFFEWALRELPQAPVPCAQRGDIVLVRRAGDVSLGIVSLDGRTILAVAKEGLLRLPLHLGIRAWRV
jgi:hypothetical protein